MLFKTLKRMIERKNTDGIEAKIDLFYAADKITKDEYTELIEMLKNK